MTTLKEQLNALVIDFGNRMPPAVVKQLQQSIDNLGSSGIVDRALKVGDLIPSFSLPDALGKMISARELLAKGPLVICFYRGMWCPYCNLELRAYQGILPEIKAMGGQLVAISPQTPDSSLSTLEKHGLGFEVLSDFDNEVAAQFGIAYQIPEIVKAITAKFGHDLSKINGSDDLRLPISATYVIAPDRRIAAAFIDPDFRVRAEPTAVLEILRRIRAPQRVS